MWPTPPSCASLPASVREVAILNQMAVTVCVCYRDAHGCDMSLSRSLAALCARALHGPCGTAVCSFQCNNQRRSLRRRLSPCPVQLLALPGQQVSQQVTWRSAGLIPCCILRAVAGPGVGIISNLGFGIPVITGQFMTVSLQAFWTHVSSSIPWPCNYGPSI